MPLGQLTVQDLMKLGGNNAGSRWGDQYRAAGSNQAALDDVMARAQKFGESNEDSPIGRFLRGENPYPDDPNYDYTPPAPEPNDGRNPPRGGGAGKGTYPDLIKQGLEERRLAAEAAARESSAPPPGPPAGGPGAGPPAPIGPPGVAPSPIDVPPPITGEPPASIGPPGVGKLPPTFPGPGGVSAPPPVSIGPPDMGRVPGAGPPSPIGPPSIFPPPDEYANQMKGRTAQIPYQPGFRLPGGPGMEPPMQGGQQSMPWVTGGQSPQPGAGMFESSWGGPGGSPAQGSMQSRGLASGQGRIRGMTLANSPYRQQG